MIAFLFITLFALLAAAGPLTTNTTTVPNATNGMSWSGEVPGIGHMTLYGDIQSVEEQIFNLVPELRNKAATTFFSPTLRPYNESLMTVSNYSYSYKPKAFAADPSLSARNLESGGYPGSPGEPINPGLIAINPQGLNIDHLGHDATHWYCGVMATGDYDEVIDVLNPFFRWSGTWKIQGAWGPGKPFCKRLSCVDSTALYWCNDNMVTMESTTDDIATVAGWITNGYAPFGWAGCCQNSINNDDNSQFSGQVFVGNGTNLLLGYGNCYTDAGSSNPTNFPRPGPNGYCS